MSEQDTQPQGAERPAEKHGREDDRNEPVERGTPVPDPEEEQGDAEDVPDAD